MSATRAAEVPAGRARQLPAWLGGGTLVVLLALPLVLGPHLLTASIVALHMCYLAQCWNISAGYGGQFSLGHSVFYGVGGYTSTVLFTKLGLSPWLGMLAGAALAAGVGAAIAAVTFRYGVRGIYFALVTLGAMEVAKGLADNWDFIEGPVGILIMMEHAPLDFLFLERLPFYYVILAMVVGMVLFTWRMQRSKFGQYLLAIREDEDAAEASGIDTNRYKIIVIAVSAALTALAGTFYAQFYLYISPETMFSFEPQLNMLLGTMVGGPGTVFGPILGSLLFASIAEALRNLPFEGTREIVTASKMIYAVVLMAVVIYLPGGLISLFARRRGTQV
jgi:branched-chain amino acid transport system permease protein